MMLVFVFVFVSSFAPSFVMFVVSCWCLCPFQALRPLGAVKEFPDIFAKHQKQNDAHHCKAQWRPRTLVVYLA